MILPIPRSLFFPYTTLFRSDHGVQVHVQLEAELVERQLGEDLVGEQLLEALGVGDPLLGDVAPLDDEILPELTLDQLRLDRKSTRLNSSHTVISYAVFCLKK